MRFASESRAVGLCCMKKTPPIGSFLVIPDGYKQVAITTVFGKRHEYQPIYSNGEVTMVQETMIEKGIAFYRIQIDKHTVRDFYLN